ncbi:MAG: thioredoxin family protein [Methanococcaceae archaeon]
MLVKVLGSGCTKCKNLEAKVREIIEKNSIPAEVIKVQDIQEIIGYGVMSTPALVINEKVKSYGVIPKDDQILTWLREA